MRNIKSVDKFFLGIVIILVVVGFLIFISSSLAVLAKDSNKFWGVIFNQLALGLTLGTIGMFIATKINYKLWRKYAFFIFLASLLLTATVFIPGLGFSHGGAKRWVAIGSFSFQPVEFLKFGFIFYFAAWLSWARTKAQGFKFGILPLIISLGIL